MAKTELHSLHVDPAGDEKRGVCMAQLVESQAFPAIAIGPCAPPMLKGIQARPLSGLVADDPVSLRPASWGKRRLLPVPCLKQQLE